MNKKLHILRRGTFLALILVLSMILMACGSSEPTELVGSDGSKVRVPAGWEKIDDDVKIREMFNTDVTDVSEIMLAAESQTGRLTIEKYNEAAYYNEFLSIIDEIKASGQAQGKEAMLAELESIGYTDYEMAYLGRLIDGEELSQDELDQFFNEYYFQDWNISQSQEGNGYTYTGSEEITVNGKTTRVHEYAYTQEDGDIRLYETNIKNGDSMYLNIIWGFEDDFQKNREEFKSILESFTY